MFSNITRCREPGAAGASSRSASRDTQDRDAARGRVAADVVRERELGALDLPRARAALELEHVLVDHAHAGRGGGVAKALEATVGVHRQLAAEREGAGRDVVLRLALAAEAQVLVGEE